MSLTTALKGHVNTSSFFNRYKHSGGLIKVEQRIDSRDIDLKNSGNSWRSGGSMNLKAGGNLSLVGAQIKSQGYQARAEHPFVLWQPTLRRRQRAQGRRGIPHSVGHGNPWVRR